jgi:hypothetical protein
MNTNELTGPALDWAVAKAEGMPERIVFGRGAVRDTGYCVERPNGTRLFYVLRNVWDRWVEKCETHPWGAGVSVYTPSTNWLHGGPIIERERIQTTPRGETTDLWEAIIFDNIFMDDGSDCFQIGPTPLIAAMRCYVASRLGDTIDIPEELQ